MLYVGGMSSEERRAWIMLVVTVGSYATYLTIILRRMSHTPVAEVPYVSTLLWTIGLAILSTIVLSIVASIVMARGVEKKDQRDKEINRFGEYVGQSFVIIGAVAAMIMAMAELDYFWIANAIYLGFVLSSILGSVAKVASYRWGFRQW
jgi:membrane protein implicated in regulation of membrane protease activity